MKFCPSTEQTAATHHVGRRQNSPLYFCQLVIFHTNPAAVNAEKYGEAQAKPGNLYDTFFGSLQPVAPAFTTFSQELS